MNRKGISPIMTGVILIVMFLLWANFFGEILSVWGAANAAQTTGIEAFFWDYINLFAFFLPLTIFALIGFRSGQE